MFKWLGFELCLDFFILYYTSYYTTQYILYFTVLQGQREGVGQKYSISALKRLFMLGSLSSMERWSVTKTHSVFPTDVT